MRRRPDTGPPAPPPPAGPLRVVAFERAAGARHMAVDTALLTIAASTTLRLYAWTPPALSLGWFQDVGDVSAYRSAGYDVVRRPTGGGAVIHHHEVTYAFVVSADHPRLVGLSTEASYAVIHAPVIAALASLGADVVSPPSAPPPSGGPDGPRLCFDRTSSVDLVHGGKKVVGSAQRRLGRRIMQHGSIILRTNSFQPSTGSLEDVLGTSVDPERVATAVEAAFLDAFGPGRRGSLDDEERALAAHLEPEFGIP